MLSCRYYSARYNGVIYAKQYYFSYCRIYFPHYWHDRLWFFGGRFWRLAGGACRITRFHASVPISMAIPSAWRPGRVYINALHYHTSRSRYSHQTWPPFSRNAFCGAGWADRRPADCRIAVFPILTTSGRVRSDPSVHWGDRLCLAWYIPVRHAAGGYYGIVQRIKWTQ